MFTQMQIDKLNKEQNRYEYNRRNNGSPTLPKTNTLNNRIVNLAKKQGGIIAGSYALKSHSPKYKKRVNDIDIISKSPAAFAEKLVAKLNVMYGKKRFKVIKSVNAYRIYDTSNINYVADIIAYPINKKDYKTIDGVKMATPDFVYKGKRRKARTSSKMPEFGFKFPNMKGWI